jgi:hypothetical protein
MHAPFAGTTRAIVPDVKSRRRNHSRQDWFSDADWRKATPTGSRHMAYRVNAQFKDGSTNGPLADVVAAAPPHPGDIVSVGRHGGQVSLRVTAVWVPSSRPPHRRSDGLVMVEALEI